MPVSRSRNKKSPYAKSFEVGMFAPQVIFQRLTQFSQAGLSPSKNDYQEYWLMWREKFIAQNESWNAMMAETIRIQQNIAMSFASNWLNPWSINKMPKLTSKQTRAASQKVFNKGITPIHKKVMANSRRLSK